MLGRLRFRGNFQSCKRSSEFRRGPDLLKNCFAALKDDGSVIAWGLFNAGGDITINELDVSSQLSSGVSQIFSTYDSFAALKEDGSVVTWGNSFNGGDSSAVSADCNPVSRKSSPLEAPSRH